MFDKDEAFVIVTLETVSKASRAMNGAVTVSDTY